MIQVGILTCEADLDAAARVMEALTHEGARCICNIDLGHAENSGLSEPDALRELFSAETSLCFVLLSRSFLTRAKLYKLYDDYVIQARTRSRFLIGTVIDDTQEFRPPYSSIRSLDFFRFGLQTIVARFRQLPTVRRAASENKINISRIIRAIQDIRNNFIIEDITSENESSSYFLIRATDKIELADSSYYLVAKYPQVPISVVTSTFQSLRSGIPKDKIRLILPRPRRDVINPEATLRSFAEGFQVAHDRVSYLDAFFSRLSEIGEVESLPFFDPLFVPVKSVLEEPGTIARVNEAETLEFINKWMALDDHDPLLVITAPGGYGKTTLIRKLHDSLVSQKKYVIYLDANEFVDHFRRSNVSVLPSTLYGVLRSSGDNFKFKENEFYLGWSLNNFVVIIDGLDEILSRLTVEINVQSFLKDIIESDEDGGGKIIITAREVFWDQSRDVDVKRLYLQPFDESQAAALFEKYFVASSGIGSNAASAASFIRVCMEDARALGSSLSEAYKLADSANMYFVPFVLEYIANEHFYIFKTGKPLSRLFSTSSIRRTTSIFSAIESLIEVIARREYIKMGEGTIGITEADSISRQFELLTCLAGEERGSVTEHQFDRYIELVYGAHVADGRREQLKVHFLIRRHLHDQGSGLIEFRYDFVRNLFAARKIMEVVARPDDLRLEHVQLMAVYVAFDNDLLKFIVPKLRKSDIDLVSFFLACQALVGSEKNISPYDRARFIWSVASLVLQVELAQESKLDIDLTTNVIKTYFGKSRKDVPCIEDFAIVNYGSEKQRRLVFDWSGTILRRCAFWEYSSFWDCRFDEETRLEECVLRDIPEPPPRVSSLTKTLFTPSCDLPESVSEKLSQLASQVQSEHEYVRSRLVFMLQKFMSGSRAIGHVGDSEMEGNTFPRMKLRTLKFSDFTGIMNRNQLIARVKGDGAAWHYEIPKEGRRDVEEFLLQGIEPARVRLALSELFARHK